jgi:hypothetical protein
MKNDQNSNFPKSSRPKNSFDYNLKPLKTLCLFFIFVTVAFGAFFLSGCTPSSGDEPELDLIRPSSQNYLAEDDQIRVELRCENIDEMRLNSRRLSRRETERLCSRTSLYLDLDEGDNEFYFEGISTDGGDYDRTWLRLNVEYNE